MKKTGFVIVLLLAALVATATLAVSVPFATASVKPTLALKFTGLSSGVLSLGKSLTASGAVLPSNLGGSVTLTLQREQSGKWLAVTAFTRTLSVSGSYSASYRPSGLGTYRLKTTIAATASHTAATTMWHTFTVKLSAAQALLLQLINAERAHYHLAAVHAQVSLVAATSAHSAQMAADAYFSHSSRNDQTFTARILEYGYTRSGYRLWKVGENLFYGSGLASSPLAAVSAWMRDPGHRAVILTKEFRDVGIGIASSASGINGLKNVTFYTMDMGVRLR
ncbi:MAG: CAP domain-containing protein [Thermoleophilia bacterium]